MAAKKIGWGDLQQSLSADATPAQKTALAGMVVPVLTSTQRDALAAGDRPEGTLIYNITTHKLQVRVAAAWETVTSV